MDEKYRTQVFYVVLEILASAWRDYSKEEPPFPTEEILGKCDGFYRGDGDIIEYGESYSNAPNGQVYIYVFFEEAQSRKVIYVGQTNNPTQRLKQHILSPGTIEKVVWVAKAISDGNYPKMGIVDVVERKDASHIEVTYKRGFSAPRCPLSTIHFPLKKIAFCRGSANEA